MQAVEYGCVHLPVTKQLASSRNSECLAARPTLQLLQPPDNRPMLLVLYVGHGHWRVWRLIFSFSLSHSLFLWQFSVTFYIDWGI